MSSSGETNADAVISDTVSAPPSRVSEPERQEWTLILVRHGETEWNADGRIQGHLDVPLSDIGREQARLLGHRLVIASRENVARPLIPYHGNAPLFITALYSSDLSRATETARIVQSSMPPLTNLPLIESPLFRERSFGAWQGLSAEELRVQRIRPQMLPPGGETEQEVYDRMQAGLDQIVSSIATPKNSAILVFGHGGSLRALICQTLGMNAGEMRRFRLDNTSLSILHITGTVENKRLQMEMGRVICLNDTAHLLAPV